MSRATPHPACRPTSPKRRGVRSPTGRLAHAGQSPAHPGTADIAVERTGIAAPAAFRLVYDVDDPKPFMAIRFGSPGKAGKDWQCSPLQGSGLVQGVTPSALSTWY